MDYLFFIGFVSILGQVALLRELSVAFYGVELIYTLALGVCSGGLLAIALFQVARIAGNKLAQTETAIRQPAAPTIDNASQRPTP